MSNTLDEKIDDVCFQIKSGLELSPDGDFSFRIKRLIAELPKPDILILVDETGTQCFTSDVSLLGEVHLWQNFNDIPPIGNTEFDVLEPMLLKGNGTTWAAELEEADKDSSPDFDYRSFLNEFIIRNS